MTRKRLIIGSGIALGLAAFVATGLVITSGQFVPPQPPSGGGTTIQVLTNPATTWQWTTDFTGMSDISSCVQSGNYYDSAVSASGTCLRTVDPTVQSYFSIRGNNATTGVSINHGSTAYPGWEMGADTFTITCRVRFPILDDGTYSYFAGEGMATWNSGNTKPTNGMFWQYDHGANGDVWALNVRTASVDSITPCATAIAANTWYTTTLTIHGSSTVDLSINGATPCASASIASLVGVGMTPGAIFYRTTTGYLRQVDFNWCQGYATVTR